MTAPAAGALVLAVVAFAFDAARSAAVFGCLTPVLAVGCPVAQGLWLRRRGTIDEPLPAFVALGWIANLFVLGVLLVLAVIPVLLTWMRSW